MEVNVTGAIRFRKVAPPESFRLAGGGNGQKYVN